MQTRLTKHLVGATAVALVMAGGTVAPSVDFSPIGVAQADEGSSHGSRGANAKRAGKGASAGGGHDDAHDDAHDDGHDDDGHDDGGHVSGGGKGGHKSIEGKVFHGNATTGRGKRLGQGQARAGAAGGGRGQLFGDMWVILRSDQGVPVLTPEGYVQPLDADGNPIALDDEGKPIDESLTVEVELGRLNVSRAPAEVLERRLAEAVDNLNDAVSLSTDAAGRLVFTVDGEDKTIDSPLENLALYKQLISTGEIAGLTVDPGAMPGLEHLVDGQLTAADYTSAASFLAGAADKTQPLNVDKMVYLNTIAGVEGGLPAPSGDGTYVDFSSFSYDRSGAYDGQTADVLVRQADGSYQTVTIDVYQEVFGGQDYDGAGTADAFAQAADDARAVINYVHEYAPPVSN